MAEELTTLRQIGIGWGPGYHLARPLHFPTSSSTSDHASAV